MNRKAHTQEQKLSGVAALLLLCVFAAGLLTVLLGGAQAYRRLNEQTQAEHSLHTGTRLIATKVRQAAEKPAIGSFGGGPALVLAEEIEGEVFFDRIYCHEGWLMELYSPADAGLGPADGQRLLEMQELELMWEGELLWVTLRLCADREAGFCLLPRITEEVGP